MKNRFTGLIMLCMVFIAGSWAIQPKWISLFNGKDLGGWIVRGDAMWKVRDGVIIGQNGRGHLYAAPVVENLEVKGEFRITDQGKGANSGLYIRANEPENDPNGFPR